MYNQKQAIRDTNGKVYLVYRSVIDRVEGMLVYGWLPETNDARRGWLGDPRELTGDDRKLSLSEAVAKFPYRGKE